MVFLFQLTLCQCSTGAVIFSDYVPGYQVNNVILKAEAKYGLDFNVSAVPVYVGSKPDYRNGVDFL